MLRRGSTDRRALWLPVRLACGLGVAALLVLLVWHLTHEPVPPRVGAVAPTFRLERIGAPGEVDLRKLRGSPVVLVFWASWCPPCKAEAATVESLWRSYRSRGVRFIGIDTNDAVSDARKFMHRHRITYAVVHDGSSLAASDAYGVGDLPVSYVIDRQGRLVGKPVLGRLDETQQAKMFHAALTEAIER